MKTLDKRVFILCIALLFLPFLLGCKPATAGIIDWAWKVILWVGKELVNISAAQILEKVLDEILGYFKIYFTEYVTPDYWGAFTGTYSTDMGFKINIGEVDYSCNLHNPRIHIDLFNFGWKLDSSEYSSLKDCVEVIQHKLSAMKGK